MTDPQVEPDWSVLERNIKTDPQEEPDCSLLEGNIKTDPQAELHGSVLERKLTSRCCDAGLTPGHFPAP